MEKSVFRSKVEPKQVDFTSRVSVSSICDMILYVAGVDAYNRGFGVDVLAGKNFGWVLSRMCVVLDYMPKEYDEFTIHTWISDYNRLSSTRNFTLTDDEGREFGRAVSQWCVIDFEKRMPVSLEEVDSLFEGKFCDAPSPCETPRKVRGIEPTIVRRHEVRYSDIDFNRHVNTMRYIRMMLNTLPIEYLTDNRPLRLDIHFAKECRLGEVLTIGYEQRENLSLFEIRNGEDSVACTACIEWR